jgi:hypothetical protein
VVFSTGCGSATRASSTNPAASPAQALRTCVDRWNQDNMLGWGPTLVSVSVRRLGAREQDHVGVYDRLRRCTVSLAVSWARDPRAGCSGYAVMPGRPKSCVSTETTFVCVINTFGGYECSRYADGAPPLRNKNATTDERGVLKLDVRLEGTHATPPLAWQQSYPQIDGWIRPWTRADKLRRGLDFAGSGHGPCGIGSKERGAGSALRCRSPMLAVVEPCFPQRRDWGRGDIAACANQPGETTFVRWTISGRL